MCSDYIEKAKEIRKALDEFAKYNPEEAEVVMCSEDDMNVDLRNNVEEHENTLKIIPMGKDIEVANVVEFLAKECLLFPNDAPIEDNSRSSSSVSYLS